MRIFINNVDSYVGKALCADLRGALGQDNQLFGTLSTDDAPEGEKDHAQSMGIKRIVSRRDRTKYLADVLSCSLVVYDLHSADVEDAEGVIKHLKVASLSHETTFVLISSVNVWAKTNPEHVPLQNEDDDGEVIDAVDEDGEAKDVKKRPKELTDQDLDRRVPSPAFEAWKYLETLVLSLTSKAKLRPHVVAAGILYGNGETTFNELFKMAWLTQPLHTILHPGDNYIPCVHVRDVARLVRIVHLHEPGSPAVDPYLLAVDQARLTQEAIVKGIINRISKKRDVPVITAEDADVPFKDVMTLDLIMEASAPMKASSFPWWCRKGLVKNLDKVAAEFCKWRNLRPIKMVVMGPPGAGAERLCGSVAGFYLHADAPYFTFESILEEAMSAGTKSARQLRKKVEKKRALGKTVGAKQFPLKQRTELVRKKLLSNVCRYRGYVLEGYPESYLEAEALLSENIPDENGEGGEDGGEAEEGAEEDGEDNEEDEEEAEEEEADTSAAVDEEEEEEEEEAAPKTRLNTAISPEFVIKLSSAPEICKARIFGGTAWGPASEEEFLIKTADYQACNLAQDGSPGTSDYFSEVAGLKVLQINMDESGEDEAFQAIRVYMESRGQYFNYLRSEEERCRERAAQLAQLEQAADEQRTREKQVRVTAGAVAKGKASDEEAGRRQAIADGEASLLEAEATPLRQYLMTNVVPTLSEGLSEVCKEQPEDPIEYLAQYLFAHAQDIAGNLEDNH